MGDCASPSCRFRSRHHIRNRRDFEQLREQGSRLTRGCLIANWRPLPQTRESRLGVITTRRLGGAVVRNRARRLIRETFRLHRNRFKQPVDLVLVARASIVGKDRRKVERDFLALMQQANLLEKQH